MRSNVWRNGPMAQGQRRGRLVRAQIAFDPPVFERVRERAIADGHTLGEAVNALVTRALNLEGESLCSGSTSSEPSSAHGLLDS